MTQLAKPARKPRIVVSDIDHERLTELAMRVASRVPDAAEALLGEMDRAAVVVPAALPAGVVRMGSTVEFRLDSGQHRTVTLVFPGEADISAGRVSVLTPIGTALIGLSAGQSIRFTAPDGREHGLTVINVEQPAVLATA